MCDFFKQNEHKKKNMYALTHYFHLLHFLKNDTDTDLRDLFNSHLHQTIIHDLFSENDIILLLDSPFFDINYKYNYKKYERNLIKSIKNNIYQKNIHLSNIEEAYLLNEKLEHLNNKSNIKTKSKSVSQSSSSSSDSISSSLSDNSLSDNLLSGNINITLINNTNIESNIGHIGNITIENIEPICNIENITIEHIENIENINTQTINFSGNINVPELLENYIQQNQPETIIENLNNLSETIDNYKFIGNIEKYANENDYNDTETDKLNKKHLFSYFSSSPHTNYKKYDESNILILACMKKLDKLVYHLLTFFYNDDINYKNKNNESALLICCENSLIESSKYLLSHKNIEINIFNNNEVDKEHLLIICCRNKLNNQALQILSHNQFKKYIVKKNNLDIVEDALRYACRNNMYEVVYKILDDYKLNISMLNINVYNPLYWCGFHKMEEALLKLLKYKDININIVEKDKHMNVFETICNNGLEKPAMEILKKKSVNLKENYEEKCPLFFACKSGLTKVALKILELTNNKIKFNNINPKNDTYTRNSLYYACLNNMDNVIKIILNENNITLNYLNITDGNSNSPLILCCKNKNENRAIQILKLKYNKYLDINVYNNNSKKKSALFYAIKNNLKNVIHLLLNDKILYSPFIPKMFDILSFNDTEKEYTSIINSYKNNTNNCNICFDCKENSNYVVKCEYCVGLFHIKCLSKYIKLNYTHKCPCCRKKGNYFLHK